jgi:GNAT superfamily N-acetyltransferase
MRVAFATDADDAELLAELINRVYAVAEKGLWIDGAQRTNAAEVASFIRAGELALTRDEDDRVVGIIRIVRLGDGAGEFGMLVADPELRGVGIGRDLVAFAEDWARRNGMARMQLELLVPREWTHPVKEFLREWYTRIGYRKERTAQLEEAYPHLQPLLATPCDFVIYRKDL